MGQIEQQELQLYIENDGTLHRSMRKPIERNLLRKITKGTYRADLAVKAWQSLAEIGAKKYQREFGDSSAPIFDAIDVKATALRMRNAFIDLVKSGEFDGTEIYKGKAFQSPYVNL